MLSADIISLALAAATVVKIVVDIARMAADLPRWAPPLVALLLGPVVVVLLLVAGGTVLTQQALAQAVLAGVVAAGVAVGVTELGQRAQLRALRRGGG